MSKQKKIYSVILIASLFMSLYINVVTMHAHKLADGRIITHSHFIPFNQNSAGEKLPGKQHKHTVIEFSLLQVFSASGLFLIAVFLLLFVRKKVVQKVICLPENFVSLEFNSILSLRAPPSAI